MKITKEQLKSVVKECLIEILSEGMSDCVSKLDEQRVFKFNNKQPQLTRKPIVTKALKESITAAAGGDPVLAGILADTAKTTLQTMLENDRKGGMAQVPATDKASLVVAQTNPEDLFGEEAASKWAMLAFTDVPKK